MKNPLKFLPLALLGFLIPAAKADPLPVLTVALTEIDVNGVPAYGSNVNAAGSGPTNSGNQLNGGNAPYGTQLTLWALATGTAPANGFTYTFFINGINIGVPVSTTNPFFNYGLFWTPPQPGVYFVSVQATDGAHTAVSLAVEFYATGIELVSPVPNSNLPVGSSVVLQAATSLAIGAVSRVDFFDESGLLGSSRTFPYSLIYTPAALNPISHLNVHFIHAVSYDGSGVAAFTSSPAQGIIMVTAVGPLPVVSIGSPVNTNPPTTIAIPDYLADPNAKIAVQVNASSPLGKISQVQLYINGVLFSTEANYPYSFSWQPSVTGTYDLTALAYDDKNNVIATTTGLGSNPLTPAPTVVIVGALPTVAITSPSSGATISGGGASGGTATVSATATDTNVDSSGNPIAITSVQFFLDGNLVGTATAPTVPGGSTYSVTFTPKQNIDPVTLKVLPSVLTAQAQDALGFSITSAGVSVSVNVGGSTTAAVVGTPPTVSITAPTNNANVVVGSNVTLAATAASTNNPGNVKQVVFLIDNLPFATVTGYPYQVTWKPINLGSYTISAQVTDNNGNVANTPTSVNVTVVTEPPPTVNITSPLVGSITTVSQGLTINANASSPSGTIASVEFFENGIPILTTTTPPYTAVFTPLSAGVFTITAVATDNAGETTTSAPVVVESLPATGGLGTTSFFGQYQGLKDGGRFAFIVVDGTFGYYIGHSTGTTTPTTAYYPGISISSGGSFSANAINGTVSLGGVNGNLLPSQDLFIGAATQSGTSAVASGFYSGNLSGQAGSQVSAIVGADGSLMLYVTSGSYTDVADGTVDSNGNFTITTTGNNTLTGKADPVTGLLTGTLSGSTGGTILAAKVSGGTFSDGVLKNLATRGQVGSGADVMIAGFVVGGSSPKQLLVRAIGPTLATFNVPGVVSATELQLFQGGTMLYSNTGWSSTPVNATAVANADLQVGAFALPTGSADSALVGTFAPGSYTAMVSGVGGATGVGLVEIYDMDGYAPFSGKKLINVSTRGLVGAGSDNLIAGFSINGSAPKRLLIRGAGPALTGMNVSGALATPHLQLYNNAQVVIRENYSWQVGNDSTLVTSAEQQTGAFAFANKSADSAILIVLPPGTYTAAVTGGSGIALVEVYEVP